MKRIILTLMAATSLTMNASANVGDTEHQSDLRYGKPSTFGDANDTYRMRNYHKGNWNINAGFSDTGYCVYIIYSHYNGSNLSINEVNMLLADNALDNHQWTRYSGNPTYPTWYDGDLLYAIYCYTYQEHSDGRTIKVPSFRIANEASLKQLGLFGQIPDTPTDINDSI